MEEVFDCSKLKQKRIEAGFSMIEAADKTGISIDNLKKWETSRSPQNIKAMLSLANLYNCSLQDFCIEGIVLRIKKNFLQEKGTED